MTHSAICETSEHDKCVCDCGGKYHGIAKQMRLEDFNRIVDIPDNYKDEELEYIEEMTNITQDWNQR